MHPLFISLQQLENGERFGETETVAAVSNAVEEEEAALGMEEVVTKVVAGVGATNVPTTSFPRPH